MARANVMQRSDNYPRIPATNRNMGKNMFDLSHDVKTTFTMGKLVPILVLETLPDDEWFIRGEFMMRFAPLYLPIMHRVNMQVDYFYVSNRILWPTNVNRVEGSEEEDGWEYFIMGQSNQTAHPFIAVSSQDQTTGFTSKTYELIQYMGFPSALPGFLDSAADFDVNAFPVFAYYMTWDQYYRNSQVQSPRFTQLQAGDNTARLPDVGTPEILTCWYRNWNRDIFTSATPTPQLGDPIQIPLVDTSEFPFQLPTVWKNLGTGAEALSGAVSYDATDNRSEIALAGVGLDIQETAGTIAQLRYALMLQEFSETGLRAGDRYSDNMQAFFGTDPYKNVIQQPVFLGSKRGKVVISEVMSTTETATLKVGNYAGQAMSLESTGDTISYHCLEHGIILGIISVFPDSSYMQGLDKMWTRALRLDYAWPNFALIGDEAILNKEVNLDISTTPIDPAYNNEVFGYNRRNYSYTFKNDIYSGLMRSTFISFHLGRLLPVTNPETTALNSTFIECRPDITRVFQVAEDEDEIYAHIYHDIKVRRLLPKYGTPSI